MELWIRSQNKKLLIKCNNVIIDEYLDSHIDIRQYNSESGSFKLGSYESVERAKEILDEIQSKIGNLYLCKIKPMVKTGDARRVKEYLEENYTGDFIMADATMDIEPINKDVVIYEMPEK